MYFVIVTSCSCTISHFEVCYTST